jgi:hypothetical protein
LVWIVIFEPAASEILAEGSEGNLRTDGLLAQAAWMEVARPESLTIRPRNVLKALRQVPAASVKIHKPLSPQHAASKPLEGLSPGPALPAKKRPRFETSHVQITQIQPRLTLIIMNKSPRLS